MIQRYPKTTSGTALLSLTAALCLGAAGSAQAGLIAWDDFNSYAAGTGINGLDGGHGWAGAYSTSIASGGAQISNYEINFNAGGVTRGGGNSFIVSSTRDDALLRSVFSEKDTSGQDYFVSFAFQVRQAGGAGGNSSEAFATWGANDERNWSAHTLGGIQGRRGVARVSGSTGQGHTENEIVYNDTYFMVVGYSGWDGTSYTTSTVWLYDENQAVISETTGLIASAHVEDLGSRGIIGLQLRTHYLSNSINPDAHVARMIYFDDLRFGDSWDSVVTGAIPEASTTALIGTAIVAVGVLVVRRRKGNRAVNG